MATLGDPDRWALTVFADAELTAESAAFAYPAGPADPVEMGKLVAWRDRLREARYNGVRSVRDSSGETVIYDSPESLDRALADLNRMIARLARGHRRNPQYMNLSKGV